MRPTYHRTSLIILLLTGIGMQTVRAETIDCTAITSLPYTIATQGIYCLTGNLSTSIGSGSAIDIQTNNVTLDLNGYKLGGLGAGDGTQANGIVAFSRKNITIKNGIVRGFNVGIFLNAPPPYTSSSGHVVKGILADQNTSVGIQVVGVGNTVSNDTVVDTGGSTVTNTAIGIRVVGSGAKLAANTISTTSAKSTATAYGIYLNTANYSLVQNNTVTDTASESGSSFAIYVDNSTGVFLRNNNLANAGAGLVFGASSGKYFNNLTFDVTTPFVGGTAIGSNND